jgi:hypothetical protein
VENGEIVLVLRCCFFVKSMKVMVLLLLLGEAMLVLLCQGGNGKWGLKRKRWALFGGD